MTNTNDEVMRVLDELSKPLDMSHVKYRKSTDSRMGPEVPYLEGFYVIEQANRIFGYKWSFTTKDVRIERWEQALTEWNSQERKKVAVLDAEGNPVKKPAGIVYVTGTVTAQIGDTWYEHGDLGRSIIEGDTPQAIDTALAGAATDCLKRCFRQFGNQFGNSLYDKDDRADEPPGNGQNSGVSGNGHQQATRPAQRQATPKPAQNQPAPTPAKQEPKVDPHAVVIPKGRPLSGRTLGSLAKSSNLFELSVLHWYTGTWQRKSEPKDFFKPADVEEEVLMAAAKQVWATVTPPPGHEDTPASA